MNEQRDCISNAVSSGQPVTADITRTNNSIITTDKLRRFEEKGSLKNGTVTGSGHKQFSKYTAAKNVRDNDEKPVSHEKVNCRSVHQKYLTP
jgi:hypothetical protein